MHRPLCIAAVLACACGSAPSSTSLAGVWGGNALTNFSFGAVGQTIAMQVTVAGSTATVTGICGGAGASVGPGTVNANLGTVGTGTYAQWTGTLACPGQPVGRCDSVVFTYQYASVLAGTNTDFGVPGYPTDTNTLSFSGRGLASGCGLGDAFVMSFIGTPTALPE
jgi:hypothetical protein